MRLKENRVLAWIVLAACVLGSIFGLGGAGMARERREIVEVFYEGTDKSSTTRHCMDAYLDRAAECARIMALEAELYLGASEDTQKMYDAAILLAVENEEAMYIHQLLYERAKEISDRLYNAMYASKLDDAEKVNFKAAYDDFWGCDKYILKDPYRQLAADFNDEAEAFPANLACGLWGVEELPTFGA